MKHAEHCGLSSNPTLNHTGELKAAIWCSRMWVSSASKVAASCVGGEVAALAAPAAIVPATRPIICLTERSRAGEPS